MPAPFGDFLAMLDTTPAKPASHPASLYQEALSGPGGAWSCDLATEVLTWTDGVYDLFGIQRGLKLHRAMSLDVYQSQSRSEMERHRAAAIRSGTGFVLDCQLRSGGRSRWMRLRVGVGYDQGRPVRIFGSKQDITAEKKMWDGLVTAAGQDPLTGLTNRRAFEEATRELSRQASGPLGFALAVLSIDDVETLRERHDHAGALACLRCLGERLARQFPDAILVSRIGGGEFALLLRIGGAGALGATLGSAHRLLTRPVPHGSGAIEIGLSVGAALLKPSHRDDPKRLFAEADSALYVARAAGSNCVRVFDGMVARPPAAARTGTASLSPSRS
ncbi:MAG: GGDEF domain-containing protein [Methylobacterium sp.]|nr:GGDEF domain-containing protein [Methylobacterium sp.]